MNKPSSLALITAFACLFALVAHVPRAAAQAPSAADRHFADGRKALASGHFVEACRLFAASQALDPSVGTLLNLGECTVKQGKYVEARAYFKQAEALAVERNDAERAGYARQQRVALADHVGLLTIWIDPAIANPLVFIDERSTDVAPLAEGPIELARGVHQITLRAGGEVIAVQEATVGASPTTVRLERKASAPAAIMIDKPLGGTQPAKGRRAKTGIFIAAGGAVVLAGGVGLAFAAKRTYDDARAQYDQAPTAALLADINAARKTGNQATLISVVGVAAMVTGGILYLVSGKQHGDSALALLPTPGGAAAYWAGSW